MSTIGRRHSTPVIINSRRKSDVDDIYAEAKDRSRRRSQNKDEILCQNRTIKLFSQNVDSMNESVLLPSKLQDIVVDANVGLIPENTNLYEYYHMLNNAKHELFNGAVNVDCGKKHEEMDGNENKIETIRNELHNHLESVYSLLNHFSNCAQYIDNVYQRELENNNV